MPLRNNSSLNHCPFCHSSETKPYVSFESIHWKKCLSCKMGWQDPYISELLRENYEPFEQVYNQYFEYKDIFDSIALEKAHWIKPKLPKDCLVIELGAGLGSLGEALIKMNPYLSYLAIEPNPQFAKALGQKGLVVESGDPAKTTLEAIKNAANSNQPVAILMDNLLEHVAHPGQLLSSIHEHALIGSKIFIEVPNESGLKWRFHMQNMLRGSVKPPTFPGHINLFIHKSLKTLLNKSGLSGIHIQGKGIRNKTQITYLSQSRTLTPQLNFALFILNILPIDRLLGLAYWLRAEANIGSIATTKRLW